jgi:predicted TIM-barrel fold metal-dependent hydrolase
MWRETTKHDRNRRIWDEELADFVPQCVLDFHAHVVNKAAIQRGESYEVAGHPVEKYDFDDLKSDLAETYPGRRTFAVCFGSPSVRHDKAENNRYVAANCDGKRFFALRLLDPADDPGKVRDEVVRDGFYGYKPYLSYVKKAEPNDVEIREMLPAPLMRVADDLGLIVMLHIPREQRLADPLNQEQVVALCRDYPNARIVLAHIGRAYYLKNVVGNIEPLAGLDNLYLDLAMLNNQEVLEHAFAVFPRDRILYATDTPIALAPGKSVEINDQYTYVTPVPWRLSISDDHHKLVFTSFLYEELRAIRKAVERLDLGGDFVEALFHGNGMALLNSVPGR